MTKFIEIILFVCTIIATIRIKKAWRQICTGAGIIWLIIKTIELYYINPWLIWIPIIIIVILAIILIKIIAKAYNDGF